MSKIDFDEAVETMWNFLGDSRDEHGFPLRSTFMMEHPEAWNAICTKVSLWSVLRRNKAVTARRRAERKARRKYYGRHSKDPWVSYIASEQAKNSSKN